MRTGFQFQFFLKLLTGTCIFYSSSILSNPINQTQVNQSYANSTDDVEFSVNSTTPIETNSTPITNSTLVSSPDDGSNQSLENPPCYHLV